MIGVSRVAIGKALKKLESEGLVTVGYGQINLPNISKLQDRVASNDPRFSLSQ